MPTSGLLGDTARRDYSQKLQLFNAFARKELQQAVGGLALTAGMRVLDAGCGTGESVAWFQDEVGPAGFVVGMDLAAAHTAAARKKVAASAAIVQADLGKIPLLPRSFDLVWSVNTVNHLRDPLAGLAVMKELLRPGGRVALGQSGFLPDMVFAWDSRLERLVNEAVRAYYRDRYGLVEQDLTAIRALTGLLHKTNLANIQARTLVIERIPPLQKTDEQYLTEAIFLGTWGERLRPFLSPTDFTQLTHLTEPTHPEFALRRPDFHFLQTFTVVTGEVDAHSISASAWCR